MNIGVYVCVFVAISVPAIQRIIGFPSLQARSDEARSDEARSDEGFLQSVQF